MAQAAPDKNLIEAPTSGESATCVCACPWMSLNNLISLKESIVHEHNKIEVLLLRKQKNLLKDYWNLLQKVNRLVMMPE